MLPCLPKWPLHKRFAGGAFPRKKRQILALNGLMACSSCEVKKERFVGQSTPPRMPRDVSLWKPVVGLCLLGEDLWLLAPESWHQREATVRVELCPTVLPATGSPHGGLLGWTPWNLQPWMHVWRWGSYTQRSFVRPSAAQPLWNTHADFLKQCAACWMCLSLTLCKGKMIITRGYVLHLTNY